MSRLVRLPSPIFLAVSRLQRPHLLEGVVGIPFVISLALGAILWDEMVYAGGPVTQGSWIGLAISAGACASLLAMSRRKWPLLLCTILFVSIRVPNVWLGSPFPESLHLLSDCFAVSVSLFAVIFRTEIAEIIDHARQTYSGRRSGAHASSIAGSPMVSQGLVTLSHARAVSPSLCTVESLPSSPA
jgi:hypothetical protein